MKLDRNIADDGLGKYAIINLRKLNETCENPSTFKRWTPEVEAALKTLEGVGVLEWGCVGAPDEFFLVKLKDRHAEAALKGYAESAAVNDPEWAAEVHELAMRSGMNSPYCKAPD